MDEHTLLNNLREIRSNPRLMQEKSLRASGVLSFINENEFPTNWKLKEKIDWLLSDKPICPICGSSPKKINGNYCGKACMDSDPELRRKSSNRQRENAKERLAKARQTNLAKYGVEHPLQREDVKKVVRTKKEAKELQSSLDTLARRLGTNPFYDHEYWANLLATHSISTLRDVIGLSQGTLYSWWTRIGFDWKAHCPTTSSGGQRLLAVFLEQIGERVVLNDRTALGGKEIDIYLPDRKVGIEYDGLYWHRNADALAKQQLALENGIQLIRFFEDEYLTDPDLVESIVLAKLGIFKRRFYASKTKVISISQKEARSFMIDNHIEGYAVAKRHVGLQSPETGELLCVVSIGPSRFKKGEQELIRFATKRHTQVVGGLSKLLKGAGSLVSYANKRFSPAAACYAKLGTQEVSTKPSYFWVYKGKRLNRFQTQKHKLATLLGVSFDTSKTEVQNMEAAGAYRVWDCGHWKYRIEA